jgi:NAD-dependent deacetylase
MKISKIVILTGAGMSAESGIKTFRDANGLWENHPVEQVASPEGFMANPTLVYDFYNKRRQQLNSAEVAPNLGHQAVARLINEFKGECTLITQNVDDLHERAGLDSEQVWHMHGELQKMRCQKTNQVFPAPLTFDEKTECVCCKSTGNLRPHIVWFGEMPFYLDEAFRLLAQCDLFIAIGTSGHVYPAAQFVAMTSPSCRRIEVNLEGTQVSHQFDEHRVGPAGIEVPKLVDEVLCL